MTEFNYCTALQGGAAGALDAIEYADITDGEVAIVTIAATRVFYIMVFLDSSSDAEAVPDANGKIVIEPNDVGTNDGRWISQIPWDQEIDHDALTNYDADKHKTIAEARTDTGALVVEVRTDDTVTTEGRIWTRSNL